LIKAVVVGFSYSSFVAAFCADVFNVITFTIVDDANRFHQSLAIGHPISGKNVNVFGPQTFGAMIGVAGSNDIFSASVTDEILYSFLKPLYHDNGLIEFSKPGEYNK
jgi:hypothetical protein